MNNQKKQTFKTTLKTTRYMFRLVWKKKRGKQYLLLKFISTCINSIIPIVEVFIPGLVINELLGRKDLRIIILYVSTLVLLPVMRAGINLLLNRWLAILSANLNLMFEEEFFDHVLSMDYETLENPVIQVKKDRANETLTGILNVINQLSNFLLSIITLLAISSIIITLHPLIILLIVLLVFVNSLITKKINYSKHILSQELSNYDLQQGAYVYMLDHFSYAKEIRLFDIKEMLIKLFSSSKRESNKLDVKYHMWDQYAGLFQTITGFIQQLVLYIYLIYRILVTHLAIGTFTIYLSAVNRFSGALKTVFNSYMNLANSGQKTEELIEFLEIPLTQIHAGSLIPVFDKKTTIEFKNVSFKYPGSEKYALRHLNLCIRADEKLCIVGENGSGKSTFIKLLTRLYFPTEGEILMNGININQYEYQQYLRLFAPVFQDFVSYTMTLEKNITFSEDCNMEKLQEICNNVGLTPLIDKLPKHFDTQIGKWLDPDGIDPYGADEHRIAIARACYHGGDIFLLDEPTAALDPNAEYEIYTQFNNIITNKCAILITHRLSAVQLADKVAVFDCGRVVEYGTHKELYERGGIYTEMFDKQAQFYRNEPPNIT